MQSKPAMRPLSLMALAATLLLGACNASPTPVASTPPAAPTSTATAVPNFGLPAGAACSDDINHYETVASNDLDTGNVEQGVYDQIQREMTAAAADCKAGRDAQARSAVANSKRLHGYS